MKLSIIIVNYNVKYFLEQCLRSVFKAIQPLQAEVWVVDNASSDGSISYLRPKFPGVNFIERQQNVGFAKANNEALFACSGEYVLFLNPDTLLPEDCLIKCLVFMEKHNSAGALGIRMLDGSGNFLPESKRSFPAPLTSFYKLMGLSRLFPSSKIFARYSLGWLSQHQNHEVDVLAGAFMLAKRKTLVELNGFDESFFMYGEDIDLSYRIQKLGYTNYYFAESCIIHFKGESTKKGSLNYVKMFYQAMSIFVQKHYRGTSASLFAFTLNVAIWFRAGLSGMARLPQKMSISYPVRRTKKKIPARCLIVGSEEECKEVTDLFFKNNKNEGCSTLLTVNDHAETVLETLRTINEKITLDNINEVIFCEGFVSYRDIIETAQLIEPKVSIRFHGKGTRSIVGSDSKDTSGQYTSAEGL